VQSMQPLTPIRCKQVLFQLYNIIYLLTQCSLDDYEGTSRKIVGLMDEWMPVVEKRIRLEDELERRRNTGIE